VSLARWDPVQELTPLREAMNRLLEDSFVGLGRIDMFGRTFPVDIREMPEEYVVEAALPGFKPEELVVTATYDTLAIRAIHKTEEKPEKPTYVRRERYEGEVSRVIELPTRIDAEKVAATYTHGMLTLHIPRVEEAKPKQITVQVKEPVLSH
jgi:HSP20 family protein